MLVKTKGWSRFREQARAEAALVVGVTCRSCQPRTLHPGPGHELRRACWKDTGTERVRLLRAETVTGQDPFGEITAVERDDGGRLGHDGRHHDVRVLALGVAGAK